MSKVAKVKKDYGSCTQCECVDFVESDFPQVVCDACGHDYDDHGDPEKVAKTKVREAAKPRMKKRGNCEGECGGSCDGYEPFASCGNCGDAASDHPGH